MKTNDSGTKNMFNPDELKLSKQDVLNQLERIGKRWSQNKKANWKLIMSLEAMKAYIHMTGEETIVAIWSEIINGFNELMIENSLAVAKGNDESWAETFEKIKNKD